MAYELLSAAEEDSLFFRMDGEAAERHGAIGHLRGDFDTGNLFYTTWFDNQRHLKSEAFKAEFDKVVNFLRKNPENPVLRSRADMRKYCYAHPDQHVSGSYHDTNAGFKIQTADYSYYVRCTPQEGDYDLYIFCFDNRYLLPELAGQHDLPNNCYTILPSSGEVVLIVHDEQGYHRSGLTTNDMALNRQIVNTNNALMDVTRAQEEAMPAGSLFGWNTPAAKPWRYEPDGKPCPVPQKNKDDHER